MDGAHFKSGRQIPAHSRSRAGITRVLPLRVPARGYGLFDPNPYLLAGLYNVSFRQQADFDMTFLRRRRV